MKQKTAHKIEKDLKRELNHRAWLEKNLKGTCLLKKSRRKVLDVNRKVKREQVAA
jgi:hypothetical protein